MPGTGIETKLLTDRSGPSTRVRVDPGQTGFFAGRFFRSYLEAVVPVAGPAVSARLTSPVDFILWSQVLTLTQGALRCEVFTGATPSGSWSALPVIGVNRMSERPLYNGAVYSPVVTVETGGSFTGGTPVDLMMVRTASQNGQSSNVGTNQSERGLPAGIYYIRFSTITGGLTVNDAAQMVYAIEWEERVPNLNGPQ
ncbi:hypothetical protein [Cupriavidus sp. D384]|uniref:hypothetical protein n=1 Tax=Cupriavidus sp. D384 TaxID=1538095 RepID=UPI00082A6CAC|nr:hypothetical protein [Cupriavidus sp. D384]